MGMFIALVVLIAAIIWKLRYIEKVDLPVRFQKEPWKLTLLYLASLVIMIAITGLLFTIFGSPVQHDRSFGDAPFADAIWYVLIPALLPTFAWWGVRNPFKFITILVIGFVINAVIGIQSGQFGHSAERLLLTIVLITSIALFVVGKSALLFIPKLLFGGLLKGKRKKSRVLKNPGYHRDASGKLVRGKKRSKSKDKDEDDDDEDDDDD